ncbi:MAG: DUF4173 domain-containing protein [Chloroflexi bacterium]|nr:DUF4173 domain-containing protein [Chloroflexota bacterium]MDA1147559.1 DUF4173 domain-containing protein [Chloroflexota bacterium]
MITRASEAITHGRVTKAGTHVTFIAAGSSPSRPKFLEASCPLVAGSIALLGLLADVLFNGAALGVNASVWVGALIGVYVVTARRNGRVIGRLSAGMLVASFGLSMMVAWRAAWALQALALVTSLSLLLLALVAERDTRARRVSISGLFRAFLRGVLVTAQGAVLLPGAMPWHALLGDAKRREFRGIGRALLIAAPLFLIFGALFVAADAVLEAWIRDSLTFNLAAVQRHVAWLLGGAAVAAGVIWCGMAPEESTPAGPRLADERRLRALEMGVVLGSLAALFAVFVAIQVQYLFGGEAHVQSSTGLTYAQYARRGFFELVAVAALLLPVLLLADWARTRDWRSRATFRVLATLLVLLLLAVMTSAFQRLRIYVDAFGLTVTRFYAASFLAWLGAVFGWLLWSLLRDRRDEFIAGAVLTALLALVVVAAANPHGTIASTNLARAEQGRDFDVPHAVGLSPDATPTLIDGIDVLPQQDACELATALLEGSDSTDEDLRSWNWGRVEAERAIEANRDRLAVACR